MATVNEKMTALADEIRELSGTTGAMGLDAMAEHVGEANEEVNEQADLIAQIASALEGKAAVGDPIISVNSSNGLITATAGTKTSTRQLAFQPAKTITPSAASQIAISSGYYTGGNVTVAGDSNLIAGNIKNGVSIFGISGNYAGNSDVEDSILTKTISNYTNDRITTIGSYAFVYCYSLNTASFPKATTINNYAFCYCNSLTTASFPKATTIGSYAFYKCYNLTSLYLMGSSLCTLLYSDAFDSTPIGGYSASAGTYGSIYVPASLLAAYRAASDWSYFRNRFVGIMR